MTKAKNRKLHKNIVVAYARLTRERDALCRQTAATEEARVGGGYVYFMKRTGKEMPPASSKFLIDNGLVEEEMDGLFAGLSQSFKPVPHDRFEAFRSQYEAPQHG